jgi:hypothetical protein
MEVRQCTATGTDFIPSDRANGLRARIGQFRNPGVWADDIGDFIVQLLGSALNVKIVVHQPAQPAIPAGALQSPIVAHVFLHRNHYSALLPVDQAVAAAAPARAASTEIPLPPPLPSESFGSLSIQEMEAKYDDA